MYSLWRRKDCHAISAVPGGVTAKAARLLDFDLSDVVEDAVHEVTFTFDLQDSFLREHNRPLVYTVMRDEFDRFLVNKAQEAGAILVDDREAKTMQVPGDRVEVSADGKTFLARIVVGADGAYSTVVSELRMDRKV